MITIGEKLQTLREWEGKTRGEVAEAIGLTEFALRAYEYNQRIPRDDIKVKIARYYGITVEKLFY